MALINTTTTGVLGSTFFGDGTGPLTIQQNGVTLGTYGNIPTFSVYRSGSDQSVTSTTITKVQFNTVEYDTNSNFDTTNYRFLPTVAGYYQICSNIYHNTTSGSANYNVTHLYKNGSVFKTAYNYIASSSVSTGLNCIVYLNGTTDYIELYGQISGTSPFFGRVNNGTYMTGVLVKAA